MPTTIGRAPKTLSAGAKKLYVGAFNGAYSGTCKGEGDRRDECASRIAWAAVKKKYKKSGDKWVARSLGEMGVELGTDYLKLPVGRASFIITKATASDGEMRWVARASDTLSDDLGTRMSLDLFKSFIHYSATSDFKPYLAVSHYGALDGQGVAGPCTDMWIDGVAFKARGTFKDTSLGRALFGAIVKERNDPSVPKNQRIRLSIAFLDLKHSHNQTVFTRRSLDEKCPACESGLLPSIYLDGVLIHLGATRVPINRRTSIETEGVVQMGADSVTRLQDAASIVGGDLAERLEELTQEGLTDDDEGLETQALVVKAEAEEPDKPPTKVQAQAQRSRRWGIQIRSDGHVTVPLNERGMGATFADYGDPVNCLFPIWASKPKDSLTPPMLQHVESALIQFGVHRNKYDAKSQSQIGTRIEQAQVKFGVKKDIEERSYPGSTVPMYPSMVGAWGGATTIAGAVDYMKAQDAACLLLNEVDLLEGVFRNILHGDVDDKSAALKAVTEEFASRIESAPESEGDQPMTVRSVQTVTEPTEPAEPVVAPVTPVTPAVPAPATTSVAPVVPAQVASVVAQAAVETPTVATVTPEVVSAASMAVQPAVEAITTFQAGVVGILGQTELSTEDRLKAIQPMLETMAGAVVESAQTPPDAGTQLVAAFSKALGAELRPLVEQIRLTLAQLGQSATQGPARKTYSHVDTVHAMPALGEEKPNSIRDIARRSTGLPS